MLDLNGFRYKKKNIQNLKRRLEKKSELQVLDLNYNVEKDGFFKIFFKQHLDKWGENSLFNDRKNRLLYRKLFKYLSIDNKVDYKVLKQDDNTLAMHFGFSYRKKFYYYKPTYNLDFQFLSRKYIVTVFD